MSSVQLAFSSDGSRRLSSLPVGGRGVIVAVRELPGNAGSAERLLTLGVTPGAVVRMLQKFPGVVFACDQTELAVEWSVADAVLVRTVEVQS